MQNASNDLETRMPELGRTVADSEGVSLIIEWIADMKRNRARLMSKVIFQTKRSEILLLQNSKHDYR